MRLTSIPRRALLGLLLAVVGVVVLAAPASAHTDLESSDPPDGATVEGPLTEVVLTFTQPVTRVDGGFAVLDGDGAERTPEVVPSDDGASYTLVLDPPAAPGQVAVRWEVLASDGHPRSGGLVLDVQAVAASAPDEGAASGPVDEGSGTVDVEAGADAPDAPDAADPAVADPGPVVVEADVAAFLDEGGGADGWHRIESVGRTASLVGGVVAVGALVVGALVVRGGRRDLVAVVVVVRRAALVLVAGGVVEVVARTAMEGASTSGAAVADLLRLGAGVALLLGTRSADVAVDAQGHALPSVGAPGAGVRTAVRPAADLRLDLRAQPWALAGAAALLGSLLLDGHTASEGSRLVTAGADLVHAAAGAVWAGGVVLLAVLVRSRVQRDEPTRAAELGARFSVVATWSIVAVALAGLALTATILDGPGDLVGTAWGRLLVLKVALVAVAGGLGAHNHRTIVPALAAGEDGAGARFARVLAVEAVVLVAVLVTTAWLVAADTMG